MRDKIINVVKIQSNVNHYRVQLPDEIIDKLRLKVGDKLVYFESSDGKIYIEKA